MRTNAYNIDEIAPIIKGEMSVKLTAYPVILEEDKDGVFVTIPDLDKHTQGEDIANAIVMARDLICLWIMDQEDEGNPIPKPNSTKYDVPSGAVVSFVDVDIAEYRKKYGTKNVKKNCTIPAWLNTQAEELGINFSQTLQEALIDKLKKEYNESLA